MGAGVQKRVSPWGSLMVGFRRWTGILCEIVRDVMAIETMNETSLAERLAGELDGLVASEERVDWDEVAGRFGLSARQLSRVFVARYGTTPARYLADRRAEWARALLESGHDVLGAAARAGYSGPGRLHDAFVVRLGMTPGEVRAGGKDVRIAFGVFGTPVGLALIARTPRGICAIRLCREQGPGEQLTELREEFPRAEFAEEPELVQETADQLVRFLERRAKTFDPVLDIAGTTFQREVWAELRRLKAGERVTYSEIARRINRPTATRAVASAIGKNPVAIAIPCHRVVRTDGGMGGYRWGVEVKEALLEKERMKDESGLRVPAILPGAFPNSGAGSVLESVDSDGNVHGEKTQVRDQREIDHFRGARQVEQ